MALAKFLAAFVLEVASASAALAGTSQDVTVTSRAYVIVSAPGAPTIELRLARVVKDDRCPSSVLCTWAGPTVIEVDARSGTASARLTLTSRGDVGAAFQGWRIALQYVEPQPATPDEFQKLKPLEAYTALLTVSRP